MNRRDRFLLGCGPAAGAVLFIAVVWASVVTPGIDQSSDTISRLAAPGQPHPWILRTGLVMFGVSTAITGLARDHPVRGGSGTGWEGGIHNLFARVAIYGILAAMAALIPAAAVRRPARMPALVFSAVALVLVAAAGLSYPGVPPSFRGLVQRFALLISFAWMAATAAIAWGPVEHNSLPESTRYQNPAPKG